MDGSRKKRPEATTDKRLSRQRRRVERFSQSARDATSPFPSDRTRLDTIRAFVKEHAQVESASSIAARGVEASGIAQILMGVYKQETSMKPSPRKTEGQVNLSRALNREGMRTPLAAAMPRTRGDALHEAVSTKSLEMSGNGKRDIASPSFAAMFERLRDGNEKRSSQELRPIRNLATFFLTHGELFFWKIYPDLVRLGQEKKGPGFHFGIGGSRNYDIVGATRADAMVIADMNLNLLDTHKAMGDVARRMVAEKGIGHFGPEDFVKEFSKHPIQRFFEHVHEALPMLQTDLRQGLVDPESWLFKGQTDGRFDHIMKLFSEGKVAIVGLNLADTPGSKQLASVLEQCRQHFPELKDAKVQTVFLSNLLWHLAQPQQYYLYEKGTGGTDKTPRSAVDLALANIAKIAPDNPFVVFSDGRIVDLRQSQPVEPIFDREGIVGPSKEEVLAFSHNPEPSPNDDVGNNRVSFERVLRLRNGNDQGGSRGSESPAPRHHNDLYWGSQVVQAGPFSAVRKVVPKTLPRMF